jgi:hypothetical protein
MAKARTPAAIRSPASAGGPQVQRPDDVEATIDDRRQLCQAAVMVTQPLIAGRR